MFAGVNRALGNYAAGFAAAAAVGGSASGSSKCQTTESPLGTVYPSHSACIITGHRSQWLTGKFK
jgi:hypothetical protein